MSNSGFESDLTREVIYHTSTPHETICLERLGTTILSTVTTEKYSRHGLHIARLYTSEMMPRIDSSDAPRQQELLVVGGPEHDTGVAFGTLTQTVVEDWAVPFLDRHPATALVLTEGGRRINRIIERAGLTIHEHPFPEMTRHIPDDYAAPDAEPGFSDLIATRRGVPVRSAEPNARGIPEVREFIRSTPHLIDVDLVAYYTLRGVPQAIRAGIIEPDELKAYLKEVFQREAIHDKDISWHETYDFETMLVHAKERLDECGGEEFMKRDEATGRVAFHVQDQEAFEEFFRLQTTSAPLPPERKPSALREVADAATAMRRASFFGKLANGINNGFSVLFITHQIHSEAIAPEVHKMPDHPLVLRNHTFLRLFLSGETGGTVNVRRADI